MRPRPRRALAANGRLPWPVAVAVAVGVVHGARADVVTLRDGRGTIEGRVTGLSAAGVVVDSGGSASASATPGSSAIPWIRVAECQVDDVAMQSQAAEWLRAAEGLWRGQQRLERGDFKLAMEAFQSAGARFGAERGEAGLLHAEGLLRAGLGQGVETDGLADAWPLVLSVADLRAAGATVASLAALPDPMASGVGIVPQLPPLFIHQPGDAAAALEAVPSAFAAVEAVRLRVARIARLEAAIVDSPDTKAPPRVREGDGPVDWVTTLGLLDAWADAVGPEPRKRDRAREKLEHSDYPHAWQRAWAELARARSLEHETVLSRSGEAVLAYLAAAEVAREEHPSLGRLAASQATRVLRSMGDSPSAARVEAAYALGPQEGRSD